MDVGGQDATEAFEDVGHSDEAREILDGLLVGTLKRNVCIAFSPSCEHEANTISPTRRVTQDPKRQHPLPLPQVRLVLPDLALDSTLLFCSEELLLLAHTSIYKARRERHRWDAGGIFRFDAQCVWG